MNVEVGRRTVASETRSDSQPRRVATSPTR